MRVKYNLILLNLFIFIVGGNAISFDLFGFTVRAGEISSIILGLILLPDVKINIRLKSSFHIVAWVALSIILIILNTFIYKFSLQQVLTALIYLFRFAYFIFLAAVVVNYLSKYGKLITTLQFLNFIYIVVCFIGFFQLLLFPVAKDWYSIFSGFGGNWVNEGDPHINRLVSTDFDPNYLSSCLLIGVSINLILFKIERHKQVNAGKSKLFEKGSIKYFLCFLIYLITILLTKSRSGLLGLIVIIFLNFVFSYDFKHIKNRDLILGLLLIVFSVYLVFFSNISSFVRIRETLTDASAYARVLSWSKGWEVITNTHFIGLGYNLYFAYNQQFYGINYGHVMGGTDSSLQLIMITSGLVGVIIYIFHIINIWKENSHNYALRSLLIAALIICNFNNLLFYSLWVFPFYLLIQISSRIPVDYKQEIKYKNPKKIFLSEV